MVHIVHHMVRVREAGRPTDLGDLKCSRSTPYESRPDLKDVVVQVHEIFDARMPEIPS